MSGQRSVYSSTVVARGHISAAAALAAMLGAVAGLTGVPRWPVTLSAAIMVVLTGTHLATVRLTISPESIHIGQGPWRRPARVIPTRAVTGAHAETLSRAQIFGLGIPFHPGTTRLTIRPGPTLVMLTRTGEHIRVSTAGPDVAAGLINTVRRAGPGHVVSTHPRGGPCD